MSVFAHDDGMKGGYVYIMSNGISGTLYIGVTADIGARAFQHRNGTGSEFCRKHGLTRLVYVEQHGSVQEAIAREKALKKWNRSWKLNLIGKMNPEWRDLYDSRLTERSLPSPPRRRGPMSVSTGDAACDTRHGPPPSRG